MMYVQVIGGFILLLGGAEFLVRGSVAVAKRLGWSPLLIGMTVVAFGTSAPELVISLNAALAGSTGLAIGNVVGSNIANVLLVMGAAALIRPIEPRPHARIHDSIDLAVGSALFAALCFQAVIGIGSGALLLVFFVGFMVHSYRRDINPDSLEGSELIKEVEQLEGLADSMGKAWAALLGGIAVVVLGADILVGGAITMAREVGVSEEVIGLTLVAFGTSLPELAASVVAAYRGHADVALGNVVGSNLFNIVGIVGVVAVVTPLPVPDQVRLFDLWVMLAATAVLIPFLANGWRFGRLPAAAFVAAYLIYIALQGYGVPSALAAGS